MRNVVVRTILWFVAVPALVAVILLLPQLNHLALNVIVVAASAIGASELAGLFERRDAGYRASFVTIPLLGATLPLVHYLIVVNVLPTGALLFTTYAVVAVIFLLQIFRRDDEGFSHTLTNSAANVSLLLYPGLFLSFIPRITSLPNASAVMLTFLCGVFFNDTLAYITGMAYRSIRERRAERSGTTWRDRVVLPVSPNKTLVGFAGGLLATPVTFLIADAIVPDLIPGDPGRLALVGVAVGAAVILGDLIESALKRSATSKDSGSIIPGRGGILDSIDSVLYAAPVFYYLFAYTL